MVLKNISAFSVREIQNQQVQIPFRTAQIAASGANLYISGNGGTYTFHASGFVNRANVRQVMAIGNGASPTNFDIEFFQTSSLTSTERQYFYSNINTRVIDTPTTPIPFIDMDNSNCLHGKITNNSSTSGMWLNYVQIHYNRMLEIS
jgi:hypothetical protein